MVARRHRHGRESPSTSRNAFVSPFVGSGSKYNSAVSTLKLQTRSRQLLNSYPRRRPIECLVARVGVDDDEADRIEPDPIDPDIIPDTDFAERQRRDIALSKLTADIPVPPAATVVEVTFAPGKTARFETGRMARQAAGAVNVRLGDTIVFSTACADVDPEPSVDFFPLRVDYAEKFSATGRTSGSYVKREGRPSEREVLVSRLIDRPLRPMFEAGYFTEVQVLTNVFSYDSVYPADGLAVCGAAAALHISHIPLVEPVAGVRLGYVDGAFIVEHTAEEAKRASAELVVAGTRQGILMIEGQCDFLPEETVLEGIALAHKSIGLLCDAMDELRELTGNTPKSIENLRVVPAELSSKIEELAGGLDDALAIVGKKDRDRFVRQVQDRVFSELKPTREQELQDPADAAERLTILRLAWKEHVSERMRRRILDSGIRPDGRDVFTVRPITIDQAPLPGAHGSSLFTRGETQTLAVTTLGGDDMAQRFETLQGEDAARFYLQYTFPPSSVGEVGRIGAPGRREIGHGKLAERALLASIPAREEFPYVMRVESNILESNGSSSMASVCGGCLALLDAGVPLKCSVAGVAMGLVVDKTAEPDPETGERRAVVLTDILGLEDALGSCDAKFAGNRHGWSAIQLDVKLRGIPLELFGRILRQAASGRDYILDRMDEVMPEPNPNLPRNVPKVLTTSIPQKKIGDLIGPGGRTIKNVIDRCGGENVTRISVHNDGKVSICSSDSEMLLKAKAAVEALTISVEIGDIWQGTVTKILPFGAYVQLSEGKEAWLHISDLEFKRTASVNDVCKVGDSVKVKVSEVGRNGQIRVSRKACLPKENGEVIAVEVGKGDADTKIPTGGARRKDSRGDDKPKDASS